MPANAPMPGETWYPRDPKRWRGVKVERGTTVEWVLYHVIDAFPIELTLGALTEDFVRWYQYADAEV